MKQDDCNKKFQPVLRQDYIFVVIEIEGSLQNKMSSKFYLQLIYSNCHLSNLYR